MIDITIHCGRIRWHERYYKAFSEGFRAHGITCNRTSEDAPVTDGSTPVLFACNSYKRAEKAYRTAGIDYLTVNRCFYGDVDDDVAIGWNGFNGEADFCIPEGVSRDRFYAIRRRVGFSVRPKWREENRHKLPIVLGDYEQHRCEALARELARHWHLDKLVWRPHPQNRTNYGIPFAPSESFGSMAERYGVALAYSTTAIVSMVVEGLPVVAYNPMSIAWSVAPVQVDAGKVNLFDRYQWLAELAYAQWHISEIEDGAFWNQLGAYLYEDCTT